MSIDVLDDAGRSLRLPFAPRRIVSLVPSITELICELGAARRLVGATTFCTEPSAVVDTMPRVGGTKNPDCAQIAALQPDIVFVDSDENRKHDFDRLAGEGLTIFVASPRTVAAAAETITRIGTALGVGAVATTVSSELRQVLSGPPRRARRVRVFCPIWRNPWMSFNARTYAADLLHQCGADNLCDDAAERYPRVDLTSIAAARPEVVLLPDEPYIFGVQHIEQMTELRHTPAWSDRRIHVVDGKAMFWYGTRTAPALAMLRGLLASD